MWAAETQGGTGWIYQDHKQDWWGTLEGCFPCHFSLEKGNGHKEVGCLLSSPRSTVSGALPGLSSLLRMIPSFTLPQFLH